MHATTQLMDDTPKRRGPKPGQPHSGQFRSGDDPRRPQGLVLDDGATFAKKARELGPAILDFWDQLWRDEKTPLPIRMRASENIVDRGHGKAQGTLDVNVTLNRPLESLTMEQLEAIAAGEPPRLPISEPGDVIEAEFTDEPDTIAVDGAVLVHE